MRALQKPVILALSHIRVQIGHLYFPADCVARPTAEDGPAAHYAAASLILRREVLHLATTLQFLRGELRVDLLLRLVFFLIAPRIRVLPACEAVGAAFAKGGATNHYIFILIQPASKLLH